MRKEFEMTDEDLLTLFEAMKSVPLVALQAGSPSSPQERSRAAWAVLGWKMGFDPMTVERAEDKGDRFFTAETRVPRGVVIRFDGPPGPRAGRFVEVERDGVAEASPQMFLTLKGAKEIVERAERKRPEMDLDEALGVAMAAAARMRSASHEEALSDPWTFAFNTTVEREIARMVETTGDSHSAEVVDKIRCLGHWPAVRFVAGLLEKVRKDERARIVAAAKAGVNPEKAELHAVGGGDMADLADMALDSTAAAAKEIERLRAQLDKATGGRRGPEYGEVANDLHEMLDEMNIGRVRRGRVLLRQRIRDALEPLRPTVDKTAGKPEPEKPRTIEEIRSGPQTYDPEKAHVAQKAYCAEKSLPLFVGSGGFCWTCGRSVYARHKTKYHQRSAVMEDGGLVDIGEATERETGISVEEASATLVTGCPHCHRSFCE